MRLIPLSVAVLTFTLSVVPVALGKSNKAQAQQPVAQPYNTVMVPVREPSGQYCRRYDTEGQAQILIGIDRTTREIRDVDRNAIPATIDAGFALAQPGDRVVVFTIYDLASSKKVLFDECLPGAPDSAFRRPLDKVRLNQDKDDFAALITAVKAKALAPLGGTMTTQSAIVTTLSGVISEARTTNRGPIKALLMMTDLLDTEVMHLTPTTEIRDQPRQDIIANLRNGRYIPDLRDTLVQIRGYGTSDSNVNGKYPPVAPPILESIKAVWAEYFRAAHVRRDMINFIN